MRGGQSPSTLLYDAAGDVTNDSHTGNQYVYDAEGRICAFQTPNGLGGNIMMGYLYDASGERVAKGMITSMNCDPATNGFTMTGNNTGTYVLGQGGEELTQLSGNGAWQRTNVFGAGKQLATYDPMGLHFQIEDALGTRLPGPPTTGLRRWGGRRMQTNADGQPETDIQSLPYGDALITATDQYAPATADDATPLHFTGKERDTESGLDYFGARYYGSSMGRFMSPDWADKPEAVPYSSLSDPQTLNLYGYMRNNPLGGTDPDGHCGQQSTGPDCSKLPNNPVSQVSPATKAQINNAVTATGQPSGTDTKGGSHEEAGISYTVNGTQTQAPAVPGPGKDVTTPGPATSDPYKTADPSKAKPGDVQADVSYHTHPSATATTTTTNAQGQTVQTTSSFVQPPSAVDIQNASPSPTINIVVGTGNKTVYVYTGAGCTCHESLKEFNKPQ